MSNTPLVIRSVKDLQQYDEYDLPRDSRCVSLINLVLSGRGGKSIPDPEAIAEVLGTSAELTNAMLKGVAYVQQSTDGVFVALPDEFFTSVTNTHRRNFLKLLSALNQGAVLASEVEPETPVYEQVTTAPAGYVKPERKRSTYKPVGDEVIQEPDGTVTFVSAKGVARASR